MQVNFPDNEIVMMNGTGGSVTGYAASDSSMSLLIMGDIGAWWGVNSSKVYRELQGRDVDNINVYISSPGGSAKHAFTIYNFLKGHKANVTAYLFGECMSAASVIANAADKVVIGRATVYMAHHGSVYTQGKAKDLRKTADTIDTYDSIIEDLYVERTGLSKEVIHDLLDEENFITPNDALELNLVDEVVDAISVDFQVNKNHSGYGGSYWDDWYSYWDRDEEGQPSASPSFAHKSLDIKYMSKSMINQITNDDSKKGIFNMKYLDDILNKITNKLDELGAKITGKDGKEITQEEIKNALDEKDFKEITNSVFNENEEGLVNKAKEALKSDFEAINNKLDKLDITASVDKALEPFNKKIEDLEVENKKLRTDLDKKVVTNKKNAEELSKTKTPPTNSDNADLEIKEEDDKTVVTFTRTDKVTEVPQI